MTNKSTIWNYAVACEILRNNLDLASAFIDGYNTILFYINKAEVQLRNLSTDTYMLSKASEIDT